jgi:hypothetical protein
MTFVIVTDKDWLGQPEAATSKPLRQPGYVSMQELKVRPVRVLPCRENRMQARSPRIQRPALSADQDFSKLPGFENSAEWKHRLRIRMFQRNHYINRDLKQLFVRAGQDIAIQCRRAPPICLHHGYYNGRQRRSIPCINPSEQRF